MCGKAFGIRQKTVLFNQSDQMLAVSNQAQKQFLVKCHVFRSGGLLIHSLFFLAPK